MPSYVIITDRLIRLGVQVREQGNYFAITYLVIRRQHDESDSLANTNCSRLVRTTSAPIGKSLLVQIRLRSFHLNSADGLSNRCFCQSLGVRERKRSVKTRKVPSFHIGVNIDSVNRTFTLSSEDTPLARCFRSIRTRQ